MNPPTEPLVASPSASPWFGLTRILLAAAALRIIWILICPNEPVSDQVVYHEAAKRLALGLGYVEADGNPAGWWPVGYPAYLAPFYALLGDGLRVAYFANLLAGLAAVAAGYLLGKSLWGPRVGGLSAWILALHPTSIMYTTVHGSEILSNPLSLLICWLAVRMARKQAPGLQIGSAICLGALIAGTAYVRPPVLALGAALPLAGWLFGSRRPSAWILETCIAGLTCLLVLSPWSLRNHEHFGSWSPVSMNGGSNLWMGNHPGTDGGYHELPEHVHGMALREREDTLRQEAVDFILEDPVRYLGLCLRRTIATLKSDTIAPVWNIHGIEKGIGSWAQTPFKALCSGSHWLLLLSLPLGLVLGMRRRGLGREHIYVLGLAALHAISFVLIVGGNRYHLPMMPFVMLWAAWAIQSYRTPAD